MGRELETKQGGVKTVPEMRSGKVILIAVQDEQGEHDI
jgi:hypothetical protein